MKRYGTHGRQAIRQYHIDHTHHTTLHASLSGVRGLPAAASMGQSPSSEPSSGADDALPTRLKAPVPIGSPAASPQHAPKIRSRLAPATSTYVVFITVFYPRPLLLLHLLVVVNAVLRSEWCLCGAHHGDVLVVCFRHSPSRRPSLLAPRHRDRRARPSRPLCRRHRPRRQRQRVNRAQCRSCCAGQALARPSPCRPGLPTPPPATPRTSSLILLGSLVDAHVGSCCAGRRCS